MGDILPEGYQVVEMCCGDFTTEAAEDAERRTEEELRDDWVLEVYAGRSKPASTTESERSGSEPQRARGG